MDMWKILALSCVVAASAEGSDVGLDNITQGAGARPQHGGRRLRLARQKRQAACIPPVQEKGEENVIEQPPSDIDSQHSQLIDSRKGSDEAAPELAGMAAMRAGASAFLTSLSFYPRASGVSVAAWGAKLGTDDKELLQAYVDVMCKVPSFLVAGLTDQAMTEVQKAVLACAQLREILNISGSWKALEQALGQAFPDQQGLTEQLEKLREVYANNAGY